MNKIYTTIFLSMLSMFSMAQNPAASILSTNFDAAFTELGGEPKGWVSANLLTSGAIVSSSTPGYGGSTSAVKITTDSIPNNPSPGLIPTISGILLTGKIQIGLTATIIQGKPYTNKPEGMAYYAKYMPVGVDSGFAYALLTKWNAGLNKRDTVAIGGDTLKSAIAAWSKRNLHLFYYTTTVNPDTLTILFSSSSRKAAHKGTAMYVDEINLYEPNTSGLKDVAEKDFEMYPNPASNYFVVKNFKSKYNSVLVRDLTGQVKLQEQLAKNESTRIDLNDIASGVYFVSILNEKGEVLQTKKLNVIK